MKWGPAPAARYERWRSQWLADSDSQALATVRWHGLAVTLELTAPRCPAALPAAPGPLAADSTCPAPALAEAACQIRSLLRLAEDARHA